MHATYGSITVAWQSIEVTAVNLQTACSELTRVDGHLELQVVS